MHQQGSFFGKMKVSWWSKTLKCSFVKKKDKNLTAHSSLIFPLSPSSTLLSASVKLRILTDESYPRYWFSIEFTYRLSWSVRVLDFFQNFVQIMKSVRQANAQIRELKVVCGHAQLSQVLKKNDDFIQIFTAIVCLQGESYAVYETQNYEKLHIRRFAGVTNVKLFHVGLLEKRYWGNCHPCVLITNRNIRRPWW